MRKKKEKKHPPYLSSRLLFEQRRKLFINGWNFIKKFFHNTIVPELSSIKWNLVVFVYVRVCVQAFNNFFLENY